jgi:hypothetical protein
MKLSEYPQQSIFPDVKGCPPIHPCKDSSPAHGAEGQLKLFLSYWYKRWPHATKKINILETSQHFIDSKEAFFAGYIAGKNNAPA